MIQNYLKIAFRNLWKQKAFSLVNIIGLAVSMSVCLLIILIIADQKSYDNFHVKKDRIYRINSEGRNGSFSAMASSALPLGDKLKRDYPIVEQAASLTNNIGGDMIYNNKIASGGGYFADGNLFKILDFQLLKGNPETALKNPFSLVISEDVAIVLFGKDEPLGKVVKFNHTGINPGGPEAGNRETEYGNFTITGVLKPPAGKTHLPFKLLSSLSTIPVLSKDKKMDFTENDWNNVWDNYTYVLLAKDKTQEDLQAALNQISAKQYQKGSPNEVDFTAQSLPSLTPSEPIGNMTNLSIPSIVLVILSILGMIVMLSACLNYTNLSVARALTRAKEVGVRKVVGATRSQVFTQFIVESIMISFLALVVATGLLTFLKIAFSGLMINKYLNISFNENPQIIVIFILFSMVIGIIAGVLPSVYMSRFNPIQILKNVSKITFFKRLTLRKALLVVQFCISLTFIISTMLLYSQIKHLLVMDYGFDKENVVNIKLYKTENYQRFAQAITENKDVLGVSSCSFIPATGTQMSTMAYKSDSKKDSIQINYLDVNASFISVYNLKLIAGKTFPENPSTAGENYVIVNEKMVKDFNFNAPKSAVGQKITIDKNQVEIVGVVKDFSFVQATNTRANGVLVLRNRPDQMGFANVKVYGKNAMNTVVYLEKQWKKVNPNTKFEYEFLDQQLLTVNLVLEDLGKSLGLLAFLAVFISCLGLLGMAIYTAESRTKEIGIRKVLGASIGQIAVLLSKGFVYLLLIAVVIAVPLSYIINNLWLNFFSHRVELEAKIFLISIGIMFIISMLIIFSQTIRAALANPVKSLRME